MIFILQGHLGDQICMLPAVKAYHAHTGYGGWVIADKQIESLIPHYPWREQLMTLPNVETHRVVSLNVWRGVEHFGKIGHLSQIFFRQLDLPVPDGPQHAEILLDDHAPAYDYVIAPFANDLARAMPDRLIEQIVLQILAIERTALIAIVCGQEKCADSGWWDRLPWHVAAAIGRPLPYIAGLMKNARKAVITVDSMANRLAHAAGVENHVLLCSDVVPEAWATHPGAQVLYGPPESWTVERVVDLIPR